MRPIVLKWKNLPSGNVETLIIPIITHHTIILMYFLKYWYYWWIQISLGGKVTANRVFFHPNVIKGKQNAHSRYYHVLHEIGRLCKANNVKWGKQRKKTSPPDWVSTKGVGTVTDCWICGTANTPRHALTLITLTVSMQELWAFFGAFQEEDNET